MSISDRLGRLLFIVPYVAHRDGVPLAELADKLGVRPRMIENDLGLLSMVGKPPLTPDHLIDICVEDDIVYVELDQRLSRPLRLTHDEARALVLAVNLVGQLGGLGAEAESIVATILEHLNPVDAEIVRALGERIALWQDDGLDPAPKTQLRRAIEEQVEVEIDYYSASSDRQKTYRMQPLALLSHSGAEYLVALDVDEQRAEKLLRFDRMAAVTVTATAFVPPDHIDLEKFRTDKLYFGAGDLTARVRFSAKVAKVVRERFEQAEVRQESNGRVCVELSTSSAAWLARWVLPFGAEAEILEPLEQRAALGRLCREAAEAYSRPCPPVPRTELDKI